ncbi:unnamed protein product, partial [Sphenostylis stenocarpa]
EKKIVWLGVFFGAGLQAGALEVPELGLAEVSFLTCPAEEENLSIVLSALRDAILNTLLSKHFT